MCVRLHPDIIVAAEVNNTVRRIELRTSPTGEPSSFTQELEYVYISAGRCVEQQEMYKQMGLGNACVGYGDQVWQSDDYKAYFDSNSQLFELDNEEQLLYKVRMERLCDDENPEGVPLATSIAKKICRNFLSVGVYSRRVLSAVGFCFN